MQHSKEVIMKMGRMLVIALLPLCAQAAEAHDRNADAIVGGIFGGLLGGFVGSEIGGRDGAVVGAGLGAVTGAAISSQGHRDYDRGRYYSERDRRGDHDYYRGRSDYGDRDDRRWHDHYQDRHHFDRD
jgi:uncharacterized protein YcfJ